MADHEVLMRQALALARVAAAAGETPVGAIVVKDGTVIGTGSERTRTGLDVTAHAEVEALRAASQHLQSSRLAGCTLYTTVEPCVLCGYAIRRAAIARVVYGVATRHAGAVTSAYRILTDTSLPGWPAVPDVISGVLEADCADMVNARTWRA
jgi:tRNA(adenine34) deaminase